MGQTDWKHAADEASGDAESDTVSVKQLNILTCFLEKVLQLSQIYITAIVNSFFL